MLRKLFGTVVIVGLTVLGAQTASAVTITASELIEDSLSLDAFTRDLTRTRTSSNGINQVETDDATIIAQNLVDSDFGILSLGDVSFQHDLSWLDPAALTFNSATLEITAVGVVGGNEVVLVDTVNIGSLTNNLLVQTTIFSFNDPIALNLYLADGLLSVFIDKNNGAGFPGNLNFSSIYSSQLNVEYEAVPEPTTMLLLGSALLGGGILRKRNQA